MKLPKLGNAVVATSILYCLSALASCASVLTPINGEEAILRAYKVFEQAAIDSGNSISVELSEFAVFEHEQFPDLAWADFVPRSSRNIQVVIEDLRRQGPDKAVKTAKAVKLWWQDRKHPGLMHQAVGDMTVAQVVDILNQLGEMPTLPKRAVSYAATVVFLGEVIEYKSLAFVIETDGLEGVRIHDGRLLNLDLALVDILSSNIENPDDFFGPSTSNGGQ